MSRKTTPASRLACARHAVTLLLAWDMPVGQFDWTPAPEQVVAKTTELYSWVTIGTDEAQSALDLARPDRQATR